MCMDVYIYTGWGSRARRSTVASPGATSSGALQAAGGTHAGSPPPSSGAALPFASPCLPFRFRRCLSPALPSAPGLSVMAAAASVSPEDLLPKGGAGKAEELEEELDDDDDDEVRGPPRAAGGGGGGKGLLGRD